MSVNGIDSFWIDPVWYHFFYRDTKYSLSESPITVYHVVPPVWPSRYISPDQQLSSTNCRLSNMIQTTRWPLDRVQTHVDHLITFSIFCTVNFTFNLLT